ncbi:hypothetical protein [Clostridium psychrophilum]|uniref:hypothetical protein n=1 Tax=Clostridium psychrophilum TaxID=132926 RepID=UPI001C0D3870|nr:hypothetical protein [Clostridium psychrophilum]MBU3181132.1 hypothetical protein [Clostridium psychrophilum]
MIIDKERGFETAKDELIWVKVVSIFPLEIKNTRTTHIVKYYKTDANDRYCLFEYVMARNNGSMVDNFYEHHWKEIIKQVDFSNSCYIYSQDITDLNHFVLVTRGKSIKIKVEEYISEQEHKNYDEHKISSR